ncbi:hypothetical protein GCM10010981_16980 [Dyella nitratireducens]|uniref:Lipoprotein n=1 Tax=Dyella nitratireducens TaxID=1849580 RepID=A0ABQ1FS36_9GAMM|nr:hypothetical protein GCM10010981_16980 [Dyella nitratireducens]GLQ43237.1 hypothetical protein GCM10007902_30870 [Dyella nitratireducens]
MKLVKIAWLVAACLLLSSCLPPIYKSLPASSDTAAIFLSGNSNYSSVGQIYDHSETCSGRKWVYGGIAGAPKWINVRGGEPVTISISVGTGATVSGSNIVNHICTGMATFTPSSGRRYVAQAVTSGGIQHCGLIVDEVGQDGQNAGRVGVTQRIFKLAETDHSSWCKAL